MNKTRAGIVAALVCTAGAGFFWFYRSAEAHTAPPFRFTTVERGSLESTVSATGALSAVRTVQVGTQVSGKVAALYVDFNDKVKKGQLLARIDPVLQQQAVAESEAELERAEAQLAQAKAEYDRNKQLYDAQVITATEFTTIEVTYRLAVSNVTSAKISLQRARQNLDYTSIDAPIDGVIVSRSVELGQTVAASLSTPEIFRIAESLAEMQILASVDESDIGKIEEGQTATFTVAAFPTRTFTATVTQKRLLSAITDNVVNYTVVLTVANTDGKLLPGMTATVKFLASRADSVLVVPNSALRFTPTAEMLGKDSTLLTQWRRGGSAGGGSGSAASGAAGAAGGSGPASPGGGAPRTPRRIPSDSMGVLWTVDSTGAIARIRVKTGITDGQRTQVSGRAVMEGMKVILGAATGTTAGGAATGNPFQQTPARNTGGPRAPGGF